VKHRRSRSSASACVARGTTIQADEVNSWDKLHDRFEIKDQPSGGVQPRRRLHELGEGVLHVSRHTGKRFEYTKWISDHRRLVGQS
jgi:hypothetical protein